MDTYFDCGKGGKYRTVLLEVLLLVLFGMVGDLGVILVLEIPRHEGLEVVGITSIVGIEKVLGDLQLRGGRIDVDHSGWMSLCS